MDEEETFEFEAWETLAGNDHPNPSGDTVMATSIDSTCLLAQLVSFCAKSFERAKGGRALASELGLHDERLLGRFRVGYADDALRKLIPRKGVMRKALTELGVLTKDGALAIEGSLIVPIPNRDGSITGIVAISPDGLERRIPATLPLYCLNPQSRQGGRAIFVDSLLKAFRYIQAGVPEVQPLAWDAMEAEESFILENRPKKAYCDTDRPELLSALQRMEIPCHQLKIQWPATAAQISDALQKAAPVSSQLGVSATATVADQVIRFACSERAYELCDLDPKDTERLRVRLRATLNGSFHVDTIDLYAARSRNNFAKAAAGLYGVTAGDIDADLCLMIRKMESIRIAEQRKQSGQRRNYAMTADEEAEALEYLSAPDLLPRILRDMERLGYLGEAINKEVGYLITVSCKLEAPLSGVILSRAGSGKSSLMGLLAEMMPQEDLVSFTRLTPKVLYYTEPAGLRHKVLMAGEEEGLVGSDYALRELISSKRIRLAVPARESETGRFRIEEYEVEGPIALLFSTTKPAIHFENATRCFMLSLDESAEHTRTIHRAQRLGRTAICLEDRATKEDLRRLHRNVHRLLRKVVVINPFAPHLEFPEEPLEMRREHEKYLSLIDAVALLHQYQRRRKVEIVNGRELECVEASVEDIAEANRLMTEILGTSRDELARPSRELLGKIKQMVDDRAQAGAVPLASVRFNRRDIREFTGWSDSQIKAHIGQLEDLEYLLLSKGERGRTYRYELAYDEAVLGRKRLAGLTDSAKLRALAGKFGDASDSMVRKSGVVCHGLAGVDNPESADISKVTAVESLKVCRK